MQNQIIEFKDLQFKRDEEYFNDGYASWEVKVGRKTYTVNALYQEMEMYKNEKTKDYTNGIKGFEIRDFAHRKIRAFKVRARQNIISLLEIEQYLKELNN